MLEHYLSLATKAVFVENMALAFFLGMCSFLAVSKKVETAIGLGFAVIFVLGVTCPLNQVLNEVLLKDGALSWLGLGDVNLGFLTFLVLIGTIAAAVHAKAVSAIPATGVRRFGSTRPTRSGKSPSLPMARAIRLAL